MGSVINNFHEYVHLVGRQGGDEARCEIMTYSLEISVDDIAGVEITEALRDLRQLVTGMNDTGQSRQEGHIQAGADLRRGPFSRIPTGHQRT